MHGPGMDADRQAMALGGPIDRPVIFPAERHLVHRQHEHLHEAPVASQPLDLLGRRLRILHRDQNRGTQARVAVEPFGPHPVVDRTAQDRGQVLVIGGLGAIEHVADREAEAETVEHMAPHGGEVGAGLAAAFRPPIGAAGQRRVHRIGIELQPVDLARRQRLLPVFVEIGIERLSTRQRRMDVAIDRAETGGVHMILRWSTLRDGAPRCPSMIGRTG